MIIKTALVAAAFAAAPLGAMAQPPAPAAPAAAPRAKAAQPAHVSDSEVHEFAELFVKVQDIRMRYGQKMQAVKDKKERESIGKVAPKSRARSIARRSACSATTRLCVPPRRTPR